MPIGALVNGREYDHNELNANELELLSAIGDKRIYLKENSLVQVENIHIDRVSKCVSFTSKGKIYEIQILEDVDLLIHQLGFREKKETGNNLIMAPMPGLVIDVMTVEGQEVQKGDALLILQAMKMENVIKSPMNGSVKTVNIRTSDSVEKHQLLIELEG